MTAAVRLALVPGPGTDVAPEAPANDPADAPNWADLIAAFSLELHNRAMTAGTIAARLAHVRRFAREFGALPDAVELDAIATYLRSKTEWGYGQRKAQRASLVDLFRWAHSSGRLPYDPATGLPGAGQLEPIARPGPADLPPLTPQARHAIVAGIEHPARAWARQTDYPHASSGRLTADVLRAWRLAGSPVVSLAGTDTAGRWAQLLDDYEREQQARGLRPNTIQLRRSLLMHFARTSGLDPTAVDRQAMTDYLANPAWAPETRKARRSSLKTMFTWAYESGRLTYNPAAKLPGVRVPIGVPQPTPESVIRDAINGARADVRVMIMLGAMAGLRRAEIAHLHTDAITDDGLRVIGKGGRVRMVPIHPALAVELEAYREARGIVAGYLFCALGADVPLTVAHVGNLIRKRMPAGWSAHKLRTRFGSKAYAGAYDLRAVQELLGHSSPAVTARYVAIPSTALTAAVQAVPPVPGLEAAHPELETRRTSGRPRANASDDRACH